MRNRLILASVALAAAVTLSATAVYAQQTGGGVEVRQEAGSEMQGGAIQTEAAEVVVVVPPAGGGSGGGGSGGVGSGTGGGSSSGSTGGGSGGGVGDPGFAFEPDPSIPVADPVVSCIDEAVFEVGFIVSAPCPDDEPADPGAGPAAAPVDPLVLAWRALSAMRLPSPQPEMSPSLEQGTYAQLATFFYLEGWDTLSSTASAGSVTSTATAVPVSQTWTISDAFGGGESITCEGPGAPFDPGRSYESQVPPVCGWTPKHSSAGQGGSGGSRGEPCFATTVTQSWDVSWTSNIGAGGDLGVATTSTEVCLVVAELQALVTAHGR